MVLEVPLFSDFKPNVLDAAVCRNPSKWKERNKRRKNSQRAQRRDRSSQDSGPTWEVAQQFDAAEASEDDEKPLKPKADSVEELNDRLRELRASEEHVAQRVALEARLVKAMEEKKQGETQREVSTGLDIRSQDEAMEAAVPDDRPKGKMMPGGYYIRSLEEIHRQTMRAFNARLTRPYMRPPRAPEEELPPLEPEETPASSSKRSLAAQEAARQLKAKEEEEERKRRLQDEEEKRKQAEMREKRRQVEARIRKLQEEEAQESARREAEEQRRQAEEAVRRRKEQAAKDRAKTAEEGKRRAQEAKEKAQLRAARDAEEDRRLREERTKRKEAERKAREEAERKAREEAERRAKEEAERKAQEKAQRKAQEEEKLQEQQLLEKLLKEENSRTQEEAPKAETEKPSGIQLFPKEQSQKDAEEKAERKKLAEQRRKEAQEKAAKARRAASSAGTTSSAVEEEASSPSLRAKVAVLGHHGAGKSMLTGALLLATGTISERDLQKRRKELDFEGALQREDCACSSGMQLTLLDVPGSRKSLPQAVQAVAEADLVLLVVSAKGRELQAALKEASGGTSVLQEQLRVASGLGARQIVVAVTKMDEAGWAQASFDAAVSSLTPLLEHAGFREENVTWAPADGLGNHVDGRKAPWHTSGALLDCLNKAAQHIERRDGPSQVLIFESLKDNVSKSCLGLRGRVEQGKVTCGQRLMLLPGQVPCTVEAVASAGSKSEASSGEAVDLQLSGGPWPDLPNVGGATVQAWCGAVLADADAAAKSAQRLKATLDVLHLPRPLTAGFRCVLHVHATTVEAEIEKIQDATDLASGVVSEKPKMVKAGQRLTVFLSLSREVACDAQGGRLSLLMLRSEETTIAVGKVLDLLKEK